LAGRTIDFEITKLIRFVSLNGSIFNTAKLIYMTNRLIQPLIVSILILATVGCKKDPVEPVVLVKYDSQITIGVTPMLVTSVELQVTPGFNEFDVDNDGINDFKFEGWTGFGPIMTSTYTSSLKTLHDFAFVHYRSAQDTLYTELVHSITGTSPYMNVSNVDVTSSFPQNPAIATISSVTPHDWIRFRDNNDVVNNTDLFSNSFRTIDYHNVYQNYWVDSIVGDTTYRSGFKHYATSNNFGTADYRYIIFKIGTVDNMRLGWFKVRVEGNNITYLYSYGIQP
jgi:hypothetical protein